MHALGVVRVLTKLLKSTLTTVCHICPHTLTTTTLPCNYWACQLPHMANSNRYMPKMLPVQPIIPSMWNHNDSNLLANPGYRYAIIEVPSKYCRVRPNIDLLVNIYPKIIPTSSPTWATHINKMLTTTPTNLTIPRLNPKLYNLLSCSLLLTHSLIYLLNHTPTKSLT